MQSVKIITTPSTTSLLSSGIVGGTISSPTTITSTTESTSGQQNVSSDHLTSSTNSHNHHHHHHHHNNHRNSSICHHGKGMDHPCGVGGVNNLCSNVSSSIPVLGICATIAFMDIKSASKAHLAEHKLDDRVLTTEYYEPSTMQLHNSNVTAGGGEGGCNLVVNSKTSENNVIVAGDMKQETHSIAHGRFTSTSSSHGLVLKHTQTLNSKKISEITAVGSYNYF